MSTPFKLIFSFSLIVSAFSHPSISQNGFPTDLKTNQSILDGSSTRQTAAQFQECARRNADLQNQSFPDWNYGGFPESNRKYEDKYFWEPILESIPGCNGLGPDHVKEFKFMAVLDKNWNDYYEANAEVFAAHGYKNILESMNIWIDPVSYLYEQQFGVRIRMTSSVVVEDDDFPSDCTREQSQADPDDPQEVVETYSGSPSEVMSYLRKNRISQKRDEIGIVVFGTKNCRSRASGKVCKGGHVFANIQQPVFTHRNTIRRQNIEIVAHEFGHLFGMCPSNYDGCTSGSHTIDEIPDIMSYKASDANNVRPQRGGKFLKFLTSCFGGYKDNLCGLINDKSCGTSVRTNCQDTLPNCSSMKRLCRGSRRSRNTQRVEDVRRGCPSTCGLC